MMLKLGHPDFAYLASGKLQSLLEANQADSWNVFNPIKSFSRRTDFQIDVEDINSILCRVKKYAVLSIGIYQKNITI